ncbi:MAG: hypothetical protein GY749_32505 [Desulfobacteraceae bacterium]|nr:hypothetical protein [Desulfobacteraceae bacterium]
MRIWLKEKIGNPELFTGRKKELVHFLNWVDGIKQEISQSTAILSRRKTGKTSLLQRLYNIVFEKNDRVIPFYFGIRQTDRWIGDFAKDFFLTFVYQYTAFRTRNRDYLFSERTKTLDEASEISEKEGLSYLAKMIRVMQKAYQEEDIDTLWEIAREAPRGVAEYTDERVVQMIDEFQFINRFIFWDKERTRQAKNLAGSYLHTCEYKNAPLLVTGSWVGWLMDDLNRYLPGRFVKYPLGEMSEEESAEMIYKYSLLLNTPVTEETAFLTAKMAEGNPFYISTLFHSRYPGKDLTTVSGVRETLEFETLNLDGSINTIWMEYLDSAFSRINDVYAKDMVLYLSKERHRFVGRKELKQKLGLDMSDSELEKKFISLFRADIIEEHYGRYRGVQDNIFDKVFRRTYAEDIDGFVTREASEEYRQLFEEISEKYERLRGEYSRYKGAFAEFVIISRLKSEAFKENDRFRAMMKNLPADFEFTEYENVWSYNSPPLHEPGFQIDIFARAKGERYSLIGEVKNRKAKFSVKEVNAFQEKAAELARLEKIGRAVLFVFSVSGFHKNTLVYLKKHGIVWSSDRRWLDAPGSGVQKQSPHE